MFDVGFLCSEKQCLRYQKCRKNLANLMVMIHSLGKAEFMQKADKNVRFWAFGKVFKKPGLD